MGSEPRWNEVCWIGKARRFFRDSKMGSTPEASLND